MEDIHNPIAHGQSTCTYAENAHNTHAAEVVNVLTDSCNLLAHKNKVHDPNDSELSLTEEPHDLPVGMILNEAFDDQSEVVDVRVISDDFASDQPEQVTLQHQSTVL